MKARLATQPGEERADGSEDWKGPAGWGSGVREDFPEEEERQDVACHWERGRRQAKPWEPHLLNPFSSCVRRAEHHPPVQIYFFISYAQFTLASLCTPWDRAPKHMVGKLKTSNQLAPAGTLVPGRAPGAVGWTSLEGFSVAFTLSRARLS